MMDSPQFVEAAWKPLQRRLYQKVSLPLKIHFQRQLKRFLEAAPLEKISRGGASRKDL